MSAHLEELANLERRATARARPVRVCFLIDELGVGGTETQLLALIRQADRRRLQPMLCLLRGESPASQALEPDCCPVLRLGLGSLRHPRTLPAVWRFARFLRRERFDVVQTYYPDSSYFGILAAWLARVPYRLRTRNNTGHWLTWAHRWLGRLLNRFTTATLTNCEAARRALLEAEGPEPESVFVLENGVDLGRFLDLAPGTPFSRDPKGSASGTKALPFGSRLNGGSDRAPGMTVGAVANLRAVKGLDTLVRAAERVCRTLPGTTFVVAGEGEERERLQEQIRLAALEGRFILPGSVRDVPGLLGSLDVAVLCSRAEGLPNAVLEYMAAARPIVATTVGAVPELIEDGVHGLLVPPGDDMRLALAIELLLTRPALARRLGEAARRRACGRYSREAMLERFQRFYETLVFPDAPTPFSEGRDGWRRCLSY
jgi:glycosyltransferase involved in cell wall biosynthesis